MKSLEERAKEILHSLSAFKHAVNGYHYGRDYDKDKAGNFDNRYENNDIVLIKESILAVQNAAYEEAARTMEDYHFGRPGFSTLICQELAEAIRAKIGGKNE